MGRQMPQIAHSPMDLGGLLVLVCLGLPGPFNTFVGLTQTDTHRGRQCAENYN